MRVIAFLWQISDALDIFGKTICIASFVWVYKHLDIAWLKAGSLLLIPMILMGVDLILYGMPHYWSAGSLIGKLIISYFVYLMIAVGMILVDFSFPEGFSEIYRYLVLMVFSAFCLYVSPAFELILICFFTGDCL